MVHVQKGEGRDPCPGDVLSGGGDPCPGGRGWWSCPGG